MNPIRVLISLSSMNKGGTERVVSNLANYLVESGIDIMILTTNSTQSSYRLDNRIKQKQVDTKNKSKNVIFRTLSRSRKINEIVNEFSPDIILTMLPEPTFRMVLANLFNKRKIIMSVRNDPKHDYNTFKKRMIVRLFYWRINGFVFQTNDARKFFSKKIQNKSIIIPNPLADTFINAELNEKREKVIISVGRLEEQKNHKMLINAFADISKKFPEYKLIIYGEGRMRNELQKLIDSLELKEKILMPGNVDNVIDKLNESEVFILSSNYEGMPNALMEAMAMGCACISTDCPCGGPKYLIENGVNGILTPVNDAQELKKNIIGLLENRDKIKLISEKAIEIRKKLEPKKINEKWKKYMIECMSFINTKN